MDCKRKGSALAECMLSSPPSALPRLQNIQALRGVSVIMVIFIHMMAIEQSRSPDQLMGGWYDYFGVAIDMFFVISGFIMVYVTRNAPRGPISFAKFLYSRITRIFPIYWVVSAALLAVYLAWPDLVFSSIDQKPDILRSFLLWPDDRPPLLAVGWTLIFEMFFYLIFAFSLLLPRKWLWAFLLVWASACILGYAAGLAVYGTVAGIIFSPLTLEMLLGAVCALLLERRLHALSEEGKRQATRLGIAAITLGAIFIAAAIYILVANGHEIMIFFGYRAGVFALPCAFIVCGAVALNQAGKTFPPFLETIGEWSYSIYLTHILTLAIMGRIWSRMAHDGIWDNALWLPALLVASIIGGGLTYRFIEKPLLTATKALRRRLFDSRPL